MTNARIAAMLNAWRLSWRAWQARRREAHALARAGEAIAASSHGLADAPARTLLARITDTRDRLAALGGALEASLDADRADYARASAWVRPLVIVRGLAARAVLRDLIARTRRELRPLHESLGALAFEGRGWAVCVPAALANAVAGTRAEAEAADAERARRLAPLGGTALPAWSHRVGHETTEFGRAVWQQLRPQLLPRLPVLVGLAVGWWIANTFTDSPWRAALRSIGIGTGGTRVVSPETYRALGFWLPILAAAICAYLGGRLAALVRRRYGPVAVPAAAAGDGDGRADAGLPVEGGPAPDAYAEQTARVAR